MIFTICLLGLLLCACSRKPAQSSRFYELSKEAKENFAAGRIEQARKDAGELHASICLPR